MIIRSKAPLRLGLAGGGSDVSPYSDMYGGLILNATINLYAFCTIEETNNGKIEIEATEVEKKQAFDISSHLPITGELDLSKGVYNRLCRDFKIEPQSFKLTTYSDAPPGSGLGSSSTMVVAILRAFSEWKNIPLGEYEIARLAYEIERKDLNLSGGKQDQYAAAFGGFNFMEFLPNDSVIVNPLRVKRWIIDELESNIMLYYTGVSRSSAEIIEEQKKSTSTGVAEAVEAMHRIKQSAVDMKKALLFGDIKAFSKILGQGWEDKKKMAASVTNSFIENVFDAAMKAGATTGKISGAGGGGFIIFMVEPTKRMQVKQALNQLDGRVVDFQFSEGGTHSWKIYS
ncbi:MAG: dehydrogenase [Bacteroidales bacterium]|nr:dehydrogenase [Bacteroidales bacterium]